MRESKTARYSSVITVIQLTHPYSPANEKTWGIWMPAADSLPSSSSSSSSSSTCCSSLSFLFSSYSSNIQIFRACDLRLSLSHCSSTIWWKRRFYLLNFDRVLAHYPALIGNALARDSLQRISWGISFFFLPSELTLCPTYLLYYLPNKRRRKSRRRKNPHHVVLSQPMRLLHSQRHNSTTLQPGNAKPGSHPLAQWSSNWPVYPL